MKDSRPKLKMKNQDGNIFAVMGAAGRLLTLEKKKEMLAEVEKSGSYENALVIIQKYVKFVI